MPRNPKPKNVAKYQESEKFSGRPEVAHPQDRVKHRDAADPEEFAKATAHENERNLSRPSRKPSQKVRPEEQVTHSKTRKTDEGVGGF